MGSLREIKDHIGSVRSSLKITSAMKLVASAKLHKAQQAIADLLPYEDELRNILSLVPARSAGFGSADAPGVALVVVSSNSSLCGAFNANVVRAALEQISDIESAGKRVELFALGRKGAEALARSGYPCPRDFKSLVAHPDFGQSSALAEELVQRFSAGEFSRIVLVYTHFKSVSSQQVTVGNYLEAGVPLSCDGQTLPDGREYILEPGAQQIADSLVPLVLKLRIHSMILDSIAAEHAARTVAMQTASDNAGKLLDELTVEYNKRRQEKITSEILDLLGGMSQ